jgi:hypothetical protein
LWVGIGQIELVPNYMIGIIYWWGLELVKITYLIFQTHYVTLNKLDTIFFIHCYFSPFFSKKLLFFMDYISISTSNVIFSCLLRFYKCIFSNFHRVLQLKFFEIWFHIMKQQNTFAIIKKCVNKCNVPFYCFANICWDHIPNVFLLFFPTS